jgi:mitochondrial transcription factor 1
MEPEPAVYEPFLVPLLSRPNVRLLPRVGIDWAALTQTLTPEFFPHQKEHSFHSPDALKRNDTLLVTANFSLFPPRRFQQFASVAQLVLYQLISAIRTSSLFQKYGLVRMLIWVQDADKKSMLPRLIQGRTRVAAEAELATEWLHEVAAYDPPPEDDQSRFSRSADIDRESIRGVVQRMQESGMTTPDGRKTRRLQAMLDGKALEDADTAPVYGTRQIIVSEWQGLEARLAAGQLDNDPALLKRVKYLRSRINWEALRQQKIDPLLAEGSAIAALKAAGDQPAETAAREAAWIAAIDGLEVSLRKQFRMYRDNQHIFHQTPPVLQWDRRAYEPLTLNPIEELFPNVPCTLLDIQPKAMDPLFRQFGPGSSRAGDYFEALLKIIWSTESQELQAALNRVWMGAGDTIVPQMASLRDPSRGGINLGGYGGEMVPRILNADQLHELLERWMEWPFKPGYMEFIGRTSEGESDVDDVGASRTMVGGDSF